jgi:bacterioferritin
MERAEIITNLQKALAMELTAAHQYQVHAAVLHGWGMDLLAAKMREEMQEELGHADGFIERILFLKGEPNLVLEKTPLVASSLHAMFATDLEDELNAVQFYTAAAKHADQAGDLGSRSLFERIAIDEEGHMSWLELQLELLERIGEGGYIAKHMSAPGK